MTACCRCTYVGFIINPLLLGLGNIEMLYCSYCNKRQCDYCLKLLLGGKEASYITVVVAYLCY